MTVYLFAYDIRAASEINPQLISFVKNNRFIADWTSPYDGCFFLVSDVEYRELTQMFIEFLGTTLKFVVTTVDEGSTAGTLPHIVWGWLSKNVSQAYNIDNNQPFPELP